MLRASLVSALGAAAVVCFAVSAAAKETVIDDFDAPGALGSWTFSNGAEFPGATGSLTLGTGYMGKGAVLAYDFTGGGSYVAMTRQLSPPLMATAIGYSVKAPAGIHAILRVTDSTNQVFQYAVTRPLQAFDASAWFDQLVDLTAPSSFFGGMNDGTLHQPIGAVSLLAANPMQPGEIGAVDFDDVVAYDALDVALNPVATLTAAPPGSSDLASRLGVNIHFTQDDKALDIMQAAGFTRVRMDLGWGGVETTKGVYDFSAFDALVTSLSSRGMTLHLILDYFNSLYPAPSDASYATVTVPAFAAVSKAVAGHFVGKGVTFEVWNEENGGFWPPKANASQYAILCAASIAAVHAGDSTAEVTTGGLAGFDPAFLMSTLEAGGGVGANAVGVHPYRQGGGESVSDDLLLMRSMVAGSYAAPAPPVWDTEWGYSSSWFSDGGLGGHDASALAIQAQRVARELLSAWALGFPLEIYYDVRDDGTDPTNSEDNFGLIGNDYSDKPAIVAVRTLTKAAKSRRFVGFLPMTPSSMHAMALDGAKDRVVVLWSDAPGSMTPVTLPKPMAAVDLLGAPVSVSADASMATLTVSEVGGPVYLTFEKPAPPPDAGMDAASPKDSGMDASTRDGSSHDGSMSPGGPSPTAASSGGCGCRSTDEQGGAGGLAGGLVIAGALAVRRRRRRGAAGAVP
jgi:MYXO-CTERM domain-containing protein